MNLHSHRPFSFCPFLTLALSIFLALASGSSSSAAAAVARKLGLVDQQVSVHCPGGIINIDIRDGFDILMTGSVTKVCDGTLSPELFSPA